MIRSLRPSTWAAWTLRALTSGAEAEAILGAKLLICNTCHGADGVPRSGATPIIWGLQENYLVKQLHDFHSGNRANEVMTWMATALSQAELGRTATYFAKRNWPERSGGPAPTSPPALVAVCQACHQQNLAGGLPAPRLAGQRYEYLVEAMRRYAEGERTNNAEMMNIMKALILVGGFGTRLRPLTLTMPKPLVPFANKPMIVHQIEELVRVGVSEIVLAVSYRAEIMQQVMREYEKQLNVKITFSIEKEPLGTAGPLAIAAEILRQSPEPFFVLNSDIICDFPFGEMLRAHKESGAAGTLLVKRDCAL